MRIYTLTNAELTTAYNGLFGTQYKKVTVAQIQRVYKVAAKMEGQVQICNILKAAA